MQIGEVIMIRYEIFKRSSWKVTFCEQCSRKEEMVENETSSSNLSQKYLDQKPLNNQSQLRNFLNTPLPQDFYFYARLSFHRFFFQIP